MKKLWKLLQKRKERKEEGLADKLSVSLMYYGYNSSQFSPPQ
jgi:hypothetical protein